MRTSTKRQKTLQRNQPEMKNRASEIKNMLEAINSIVDDSKEQISDLVDRAVVVTQPEQQKEKTVQKSEASLRYWDI